jgi:hypothetical protein
MGDDPDSARRLDGGQEWEPGIRWGPFVLAIASAALLGVGAIMLLDNTDPDARFFFAVRVIVGPGLAILAIWAVYNRHWLGAAFAALFSAITPLAAGWAWVAILSIVLALWSLAIVWGDIVNGRNV